MNALSPKPVVLACCLLLAAQASAEPSVPLASVDELVRSAGLAFEGTVVSVEYANSQPSTEQPKPQPYTFVTYEVKEVLKGSVEGSRFTLRLLGGPLEGDTFMRVEQFPSFDVGDHDVLLVQDNTSAACPLAGCAQGRFRMVDGFVVNEYGQRLQFHGTDLAAGPAVKLTEIDTHDIGPFHLNRVERDAAGVDQRQGSEQAKASLDPKRDPAPEALIQFVRTRIETVHLPEELAEAKRNPMPSADVHVPFAAPQYRPQAQHADEEASAAASKTPAGAVADTQNPPSVAAGTAQPAPATPSQPNAPPRAEEPVQAPQRSTTDARTTRTGDDSYALWFAPGALVLGAGLVLAMVQTRARPRRSRRPPKKKPYARSAALRSK